MTCQVPVVYTLVVVKVCSPLTVQAAPAHPRCPQAGPSRRTRMHSPSRRSRRPPLTAQWPRRSHPHGPITHTLTVSTILHVCPTSLYLIYPM